MPSFFSRNIFHRNPRQIKRTDKRKRRQAAHTPKNNAKPQRHVLSASDLTAIFACPNERVKRPRDSLNGGKIKGKKTRCDIFLSSIFLSSKHCHQSTACARTHASSFRFDQSGADREYVSNKQSKSFLKRPVCHTPGRPRISLDTQGITASRSGKTNCRHTGK